jgi:hypothetical protein
MLGRVFVNLYGAIGIAAGLSCVPETPTPARWPETD